MTIEPLDISRIATLEDAIEIIKLLIRNFLFALDLERGPARTMQRRLIKHWNAILRFLHHPTLYEPTNNMAEQTMRIVVRVRRQTQGSRSV